MPTDSIMVTNPNGSTEVIQITNVVKLSDLQRQATNLTNDIANIAKNAAQQTAQKQAQLATVNASIAAFTPTAS